MASLPPDPALADPMMRELRAVEARMHVRDEIPFFTGRRIETTDVTEVLA